MHLPERVSHPISLFLLLLAGIFIGNEGIYRRSSKIIFLGLILFSGFSNFKNMIRKNHQFELEKNTCHQILDSITLNSDNLYIGAVDDLMHPLMHPFQCFKDSQLLKINIYDFGHLSNTPICDAQLNRFSIDNIHLSAIDNDSIFLIHRNESEFLIWYANFVHRHYDRIIQYEKVFSTQEIDLAIYKIKSKRAALDQMIYQADELKFLNKEYEKEIFYY